MESTPRAPRAGDMVIVLAKMNSGKVTELSGYVEDVSMDYVYFALDTICLGPDPEVDDHPPLEEKTWRTIHLLRVGVPLDDLKPFGGMLDDNVPCWLVRV